MFGHYSQWKYAMRPADRRRCYRPDAPALRTEAQR
jgi:hypothetical protein